MSVDTGKQEIRYKKGTPIRRKAGTQTSEQYEENERDELGMSFSDRRKDRRETRLQLNARYTGTATGAPQYRTRPPNRNYNHTRVGMASNKIEGEDVQHPKEPASEQKSEIVEFEDTETT